MQVIFGALYKNRSIKQIQKQVQASFFDIGF